MSEVLLVSDAVAPLVRGEAPLAAAGLCHALAGSGHVTKILTLAPGPTSDLPGLARRLRPVPVTVGGQEISLTLLEGPAPQSRARLLLLARPEGPLGRDGTAALLGSAAEALTREGVAKPDVVIGWGEGAAVALAATGATTRLFVLPSGRTGPELTDDEVATLGTVSFADDTAGRSLVALGAASAHAIITPSPTASQLLQDDAGLRARGADQPILAVRFGCDEAPNDPSSDPALAETFSKEKLDGKASCRRALARRLSLALGPRTLLLSTAPLRRDRGGDAVLSALEQLGGHDVVVVISGDGDRDLVDRAKVLAIEHPGRIAITPDGGPELRELRAASDAVLLTDLDDRTARAAGLAQRYGALPIAPDTEANRDFLIDYDPGSATGGAILFDSLTAFDIVAAVRRAIAVRHDSDAWSPLVKGLLGIAPTWADTAAFVASQFLPPTRA